MRLWVRTLIRNSFFQVGAGILITMMIGGVILQWLEPGEISKDNNPFSPEQFFADLADTISAVNAQNVILFSSAKSPCFQFA